MDRFNPSFLTMLASAAIVVASLHFAQPVLMPLAVAMLLSVVLTPAVRRVERVGVGRVPAVILVAALVSGALFALGWVVVGQVTEVVSLLPEYRANVRDKVASLQESLGSFERAARRIEELEEEIAGASEQPEPGAAPKVEVVESERKITDILSTYAGSIAAPIGTAGLVIVMLVFILIQREDLRDRLLRVLGSRDLWLTTAAIDDASDRVTSYLRAYTLLNFGHGVVVAVGLWLIGLPAALLFGLVAFALRFIPYVGPWIAAVLPVALSVAVFDGWTWTLVVIAYLAAVELISNNVFEPWLYGASVGLSPFAVIVAAVFWAWVWGGVGLVVAIPLTVCLVVMGRHVPQLQFLAVLLGDEPALAPAIRLYQRLLARDVDEADDLVEAACEEKGADVAVDSLVLPALALLDYERRLGRLDDEDVEAAKQTFGTLTGSLEECLLAKPEESGAVSPAAAASEAAPNVLCLPAGAFADEVACDVLARVLAKRGIRVRTLPRVLTGEMIERVLADRPDVVLISALPPTGGRVVRYLCRRLVAADAGIDTIVGLWGAEEELEPLRKHFAGKCIRVVATFAEASRLLVERVEICAQSPEHAPRPREEADAPAPGARRDAARGEGREPGAGERTAAADAGVRDAGPDDALALRESAERLARRTQEREDRDRGDREPEDRERKDAPL